MTLPDEPVLPPGSPPLPPPDRFTLSDGYEAAYRLWRPSGPPRGLVIALHGIQSHSGWYGWSSARLADAGYVVAFLDRRGSGANAVDRGYAPHPDRLIHDVRQFAAHLGRIGFAGLPRMLLSISWGGKIAAAAAAAFPKAFDGLALLTPGLCPRVKPGPAQRIALRAFRNTRAGRKPIAIPLEPALFTDGLDFQRFLRDDPLLLREATIRFLAAGLVLDRAVQDRAASIQCPVLLMLAGRDRIIDNAATWNLLGTFGSREKTVTVYPAACHTLEFEPDHEVFADDLIGWLGRIRPGLR